MQILYLRQPRSFSGRRFTIGGMTAQMKMVVDKVSSKDDLFHTQKKKVGIVVIDASPADDSQYKLIGDQF